jgi:undecaprenyl-diphosphatase
MTAEVSGNKVVVISNPTAGRRGLAASGSIVRFLCLKRLAGRPRPYEVWGDLPCLLAPPDRFPFPSVRTMRAFAVWSACSQLIPDSSCVLLPVAAMIGLSRIFLGFHYPTDVLAGALLGSGLGLGAARVAVAVGVS